MKRYITDLDIRLDVQVKLKERRIPYKRPFVMDENDPVIRQALDVVKRSYGRIEMDYGLSVADDNVFAEEGKRVIIMGAKGENEHTGDEWVSLKSMDYLSATIAEIVRNIKI